ncbi:hypothetical protein R3X44_24355, partial [Salmonella enterica subsp. enterica serovar Kentucky]
DGQSSGKKMQSTLLGDHAPASSKQTIAGVKNDVPGYNLASSRELAAAVRWPIVGQKNAIYTPGRSRACQ